MKNLIADVHVRSYGGTYIARLHKHTASCTASPEHAACAVAAKVMPWCVQAGMIPEAKPASELTARPSIVPGIYWVDLGPDLLCGS